MPRMPDGKPLPPVETRFKPGQSGNPGGRKPGADVGAAMARRLALEPAEDGIGKGARELGDVLLDVATGKRDPASIDSKVALALVDRFSGPTEKRVEMSGTLEHVARVHIVGIDDPEALTE